jgi:hypothetical protein
VDLRLRVELVATAYADAALTTGLAGSGIIRQCLLDHGYTATVGNSVVPRDEMAMGGNSLVEVPPAR